jgi:hypothetical protein
MVAEESEGKPGNIIREKGVELFLDGIRQQI